MGCRARNGRLVRSRRIVAWLTVCGAALAVCGSVLADDTSVNPLAAEQGYRQTVAMPQTLPPLAPVLVGLVDGGLDGVHPDLQGRIVAARSFGGLDPLFPDSSHGTMVAGLIAATAGNGVGIDGLSPSARLVVASVSRRDNGYYRPAAVADAIRWTVDQGVRVVNLSLAGSQRTPAIAAAVRYAARKDVLVVAAAGNCFPGCGAAGAGAVPCWRAGRACRWGAGCERGRPRSCRLLRPARRRPRCSGRTADDALSDPQLALPSPGGLRVSRHDRLFPGRRWRSLRCDRQLVRGIDRECGGEPALRRPPRAARRPGCLAATRSARPLRGGGFGVVQVEAALERALHGPLPATSSWQRPVGERPVRPR